MIKVEPGKPIGYHQLILVRELDPIIKSNYKERMVEVVCPICNKNFVTALRKLTRKPTKSRNPVSCCPDCSKKKQNEHLKELGKKNIIDIAGQKFGHLTPLYALSERKCRSVIWHCQCDCGGYKDVSQIDLQRGHTTKCDFCSQGQGKPKDISNQRFGKLVALYPTDKRDNGSIVWYCKCDCGNYCCKSSDKLVQGHTKSCGCMVSNGEELLQNIFLHEQIEFETQKTFEKCRNPKTNILLKFDFYLPKYNLCIEYDGIQHFEYSNHGWNTKEKFDQTQYRDSIKNKFCEENNINLIRIPYTEFDKINASYIYDLLEK